MIGDAMPAAGEPPFADHFTHRVPIGGYPVARPEHHRSVGLWIFESRFTGPPQVDLPRIHDVEHEHLMATMAKETEGLEGEHAVQQQVGHENHQPPTAQLPDHAAQRRLGCGSPACTHAAEDLEQLTPVAETCAGRRNRADVVIKHDEPGRITLTDENQ